jgi:hypothetical protein
VSDDLCSCKLAARYEIMAARINKTKAHTRVLRLDVNYFSRRYVLLTVLIRKESQRFHNVYITFYGFPYVYVHCRPCSGQRVKWRIKCTFYQRLDSPQQAATFPIPASFFVCAPPIYQASGILSTGSREFSALGIIISGRALGTQALTFSL